ncbi:prephenate dehydratase [bacterium]|nr:prephenate dehydratase [bacterium]
MSFLAETLKIAFLGPGGSYCEIAKDEFKDKYDIYPVEITFNTISKVIDFVDNNPLSLGVIPLENTLEGAVRESSDNLIKTKNPNIRILSEIVIPIQHCLLSKVTEIYSITGVIAHPRVIEQCNDFISTQLPLNLDIIKTSSTEEAARLLDGYNLTYSIIGSKKTASAYNLNIVCENINNDKMNTSRFALIGDFETQVTGNDKTSIAFSTENKSGALLEIMQIFAQYNVNLTYIDSRPSREKFGDYIFYVDLDGHIKNENVAEALLKIKEKVKYYRFVGSYEKSNVII